MVMGRCEREPELLVRNRQGELIAAYQKSELKRDNDQQLDLYR